MPMKSLFTTLILFVGLIPIAEAQEKYEVMLLGKNQVPTVETPAGGLLEVWIKNDTLYVSGEFESLEGPYRSGSIHQGRRNETGNQLYRLKAELNDGNTSGVFKPEDNAFPLSEAVLNALRDGEMYINISSFEHQFGEIRGQIPKLVS